MSQAVVIACSRGRVVTSFLPFLEPNRYGEPSASLFCLEDEVQLSRVDRRWFLRVSRVAEREIAIEDYESNPDLDQEFREDVARLEFFDLGFTHIDAARTFLKHVARAAVDCGEPFWIDTDYGWVIAGTSFLRELEADPGFDWRRKKDCLPLEKLT